MFPFRVRKDDEKIISKLSSSSNVNQYIRSLIENDINPIVFDMTNYDETKECFLFEEDDISFNVPAKYLKDEKGEFKSKQIVVENGGKKYSVYFMNEK